MLFKFLIMLCLFSNSMSFSSKQPQIVTCNEKIEVADYCIIEQDGYIEDNRIESNFSLSNSEVSLSSSNMINYHTDTKSLTYEYFDVDSYPRRSTKAFAYDKSCSLTKIKKAFAENEEMLKTEPYVPNDANYGISPNTILGDDGRLAVNSPKSWPYLGITLIKAYFNNLKGSDGKTYSIISSGTGFMEGPDLMVTAGHVIFGDVTNSGVLDDKTNNPRFPDKIEVYAGFDSSIDNLNSSYRYYAEVDVINIQKEYYLSPSFDYDWAACKLDRDLGNSTGWYGKIGNWYVEGASVYSYGYPGDKSNTMWEEYGKTVSQTVLRIDYDFDSVSGQSGSPVFMTSDDGSRYVCAIHTAGGSTTNGGTKINSFIFHYLNSFVTNHNYEHFVTTLAPTDYGFADAYPTDIDTKTQYKTHTLSSGFQFQTRRYRTGYIHNEYIVMSPFRSGITEAFIEYKFDVPVSKIKVDLSHWRSLSNEWTYSSNCIAVLRTPNGDGYTTVLDLLSKETNLPTDREHPATYIIEFSVPVYTFEFYMQSKRINTNDNNRGRICIGNMDVYTTEGYY